MTPTLAYPDRAHALQAARPHLASLYGDWLRAGREDVAAYVGEYRARNGQGHDSDPPTHAQVAAAVPSLYGSQAVAAFHLRCLNGRNREKLINHA